MKKNVIIGVAIVLFIILATVKHLWPLLLIIIFVLLGMALIYFGPEKFLDILKEYLTYGKDKIKQASAQNNAAELTIHDVEVQELEGKKFELSVFTEKGKITLAPRQFNLIPEVLQKGKKVTYRESYIWLDGIIKKRITLSAIGSDGEERTFEVAVGL